MEYGLKLKYDLVTQIISIVDGSPLYQHSVDFNPHAGRDIDFYNKTY